MHAKSKLALEWMDFGLSKPKNDQEALALALALAITAPDDMVDHLVATAEGLIYGARLGDDEVSRAKNEALRIADSL